MKIFFDITKSCNANCIYCFTESIKGKIIGELTDKEIDEFFQNLIENQVPAISIGGGEPMLRNIPNIINKFGSQIKISLTTNGMIISEALIKSLLNNKMTKITISLDSINPLTNEKVRKGIKTKEVIANIEKLTQYSELRERLSVRMIVSRYNMDELYDVIDFCNSKEIPNLKINSTNPFGRAELNREIIPEFELFMNKLEEIGSICNQNNLFTEIELPIRKYLNKDKVNLCSLGNESLYVNSYGDCYPCAFSNSNLRLGNIKEHSIKELIVLGQKFSHDNVFCQNCEINRYRKYQ